MIFSKNKKGLALSLSKGFTMVELIVTIAIIAILAGIVLVSVSQYTSKSKIARAYTDIQNMAQSLSLFYIQYGDYPYETTNNTRQLDASNSKDSYLTVGGEKKYFSEFSGFSWAQKNATYFINDGEYIINFISKDCIYIRIWSTARGGSFGTKYIVCGSATCPCLVNDKTFRTTAPY